MIGADWPRERKRKGPEARNLRVNPPGQLYGTVTAADDLKLGLVFGEVK
jgi:hypothetical protein